MYYFYMGKVLLPISPSKIQTVINNQNKTMNLMNEGEVNIMKPPGLTTIKFDVILPLYTRYPFARYKNGAFEPAGYYLEHFEKLKVEQRVFQFIINRFQHLPGQKVKQNVLMTNMSVTLENYTVTEDSTNAPDILVAIELKQYIKYGTITKEIDTSTNTVKKSVKGTSFDKAIPNIYTVVKGDTLWVIAKRLLGDGAKCWNLAKLNGISNPNKLKIGQVLKIQDVKPTTSPSIVKASTKSNNSSTSDTNVSRTTTQSSATVTIKTKPLSSNNYKESLSRFKNPTGILSSDGNYIKKYNTKTSIKASAAYKMGKGVR